MQLETLKVFCDVVETKSFSKAAVLNFISQSAVSQQMRSLEERYDHKLIERGKRNLSPTLAGQSLYEVAKDVLLHLETLEQRLRRLSKSVTGEVRVATIYSVGIHELQPYITEFIRRYPGARARLEYSRANRIYEAVVTNAADVGIVAYPARRSGLEILPFKKDELVLVCHTTHPLARSKRVEITKLQGQPFVGFERDIPTRRAIDRILRNHRIKVSMVMEFDNIETIKRAVEINAGISILPRMTIDHEVSLGTLVAVRFSRQSYMRPLGILVKRGREIPTVMQRFLDLLLDEG
ncbi:MAG: LysR family transcriptional regulator [Candidatus Eisenbacteria sp.]|nr:LysR family transcriptional regulator [Candidatus Eisenbacteria bacterium]